MLVFQKAADVWKEDVWDFQALSQTFFELRFSLGNEGKTPRLGPEVPDVLLPDIRDHPSIARLTTLTTYVRIDQN